MAQYQKSLLQHNFRGKNLQLRSTNYLSKLRDLENENLSSSQGSSLSRSSSTESQSSNFYLDIPQQASPQIPYIFSQLSMVSSLTKVPKSHFATNIDEKKRNYSLLMINKEANRQKFIQKMSQSLKNVEHQNQALVQSTQIIFLQKQNQQSSLKEFNEKEKSIKIKLQKETKRQKKGNVVKIENLGSSVKSELDFMLSSKRDDFQNKQKRKKVILKGKFSSSKQKQDNASQESNIFKEEIKVNKVNFKELNEKGNLNDSKQINQFMFLQQYQRDQKQIMNRLLCIIEKDYAIKAQNSQKTKGFLAEDQRQSMLMSKNRSLRNSIQYPTQQFDSQYSCMKPIVINNYIKSPTDLLDRSLMEKQISIRLLEQNKMKKKTVRNSVDNSRIILESSSIRSIAKEKNFESSIEHPTNQKSITKEQSIHSKNEKRTQIKVKFPFEQNEIQPNVNELDNQEDLDFQLLYQKLKNNKAWIDDSKSKFKHKNSHQQPSSTKTTQYPKDKNEKNALSNKFQQDSLAQKQSQNKKNQNLNTIPNHKKQQIVTEFSLNSSIQSQQNKEIHQEKKQSIAMEISFGDENPIKQNISLADAFKKKFGAKKNQVKAKTKDHLQQNNNEQTQALSQLKTLQKSTKGKQNVRAESFKSQKMSQIPKNLCLKLKKGLNSRDKQNFNSIQTPRYQSSHNSSTERSICTTNMSKQPSKQLLDRLIYGHKANISKKEMYELTKKNYYKLPEIQAKRKQQEKRVNQIERLEKIKQYQKKIRTSKHSIQKDSMKTSIESNY